MPKVTTLLCSRKSCNRETVGGFRQCQHHRDIRKKSSRKFREKATKRIAKEGHRICAKCHREKPEHQFKSCISRRKTLVKLCATCRATQSKSQRNETTNVGKCRKSMGGLEGLAELSECAAIVGSASRPIIPSGEKVHNCSEYAWWARNGGPEALRKELSKCRPLCTFRSPAPFTGSAGGLGQPNGCKEESLRERVQAKD